MYAYRHISGAYNNITATFSIRGRKCLMISSETLKVRILKTEGTEKTLSFLARADG
jgi:hypothetical protein